MKTVYILMVFGLKVWHLILKEEEKCHYLQYRK